MKMKLAIAVAILPALGGLAQAHLTPYQGTHRAAGADIMTQDLSQDLSSAHARLERSYFRAPPFIMHDKIGRCTVSTFVFTKMRLARACY